MAKASAAIASARDLAQRESGRVRDLVEALGGPLHHSGHASISTR